MSIQKLEVETDIQPTACANGLHLLLKKAVTTLFRGIKEKYGMLMCQRLMQS
jgi:hypothetical protein